MVVRGTNEKKKEKKREKPLRGKRGRKGEKNCYYYYVHAKKKRWCGRRVRRRRVYIYTRNCGDYNDIWNAVVERMHRCAKAPLIMGQQWARIIFLDNIIMKTAKEVVEGGIRRVIRSFFCGAHDDSRRFFFLPCKPRETGVMIITY